MRLVASAIALGSLISASAFAQPVPPAAAPIAAPPAEMVSPTPVAPPPGEAMPAMNMPVTSPMTTPTPDKAPVVPPKPWYHNVTLDGTTDAFYMYNFSANTDTSMNPSGTLLAPSGRAFDTQSNSFTLNYAKVGVGVAAENVAMRLDLGYGHTGAIINGSSGSSSGLGSALMPNAASSALYGNAFIVQQAYASLTLGQLSVDFGKFVTTAGSEVIETSKNWMYSRSLLFNAIPFLHTGARLNFKANDMVTLQASIVNGWNNDPDNNGDKTFGLAVNLTPMPALNVIATGYFGKEATMGSAATIDTRMLIDLVAAYTLSDKIGLNLNVDFIKEGDPTLFGVAAMGRFVLHDHAVLAVRGELLNLDSGASGVDATKVYEGTLGMAFPWAGHYEARVEVRGDFASEDIYTDGTGIGGAQGSQFTGTVGGLFSF